MLTPARLLIIGLVLILSACIEETVEPTTDPAVQAAIASTVEAQATAFAERGDPATSVQTLISCEECDSVEVSRLIDGETLDTSIGRVELFGADVPDQGEECASAATEFTRSILSSSVRLEYGPPLRDEFSTSRSYVFDSIGNSLDYQLIESGFARARTRSRDELSGPHQAELVALQTSAQNRTAGCLWKDFVVLTAEPTLTPTTEIQASFNLTATAAADATAAAKPPTITPVPTPIELSTPTVITVPTPTAIPTAVPTPAATTEPTPEVLPTSTPEPTATTEPTPEALPTSTPEPTATAAPPPTLTPVPVLTPTPVPTATFTPTVVIPTPTLTVTPTPTLTVTPTPTLTPPPAPTPTPRISVSPGSTPFGLVNGSTTLDDARVIFDGPVGVISAKVKWAPGLAFFTVTVIQETGEIIAGAVYTEVGLYVVEIVATTDEGDTASATINALVN